MYVYKHRKLLNPTWYTGRPGLRLTLALVRKGLSHFFFFLLGSSSSLLSSGSASASSASKSLSTTCTSSSDSSVCVCACVYVLSVRVSMCVYVCVHERESNRGLLGCMKNKAYRVGKETVNCCLSENKFMLCS